MSKEHPYAEDISWLHAGIEQLISGETDFNTATDNTIQQKIDELAILAVNLHHSIEDESEDETPEVLMEDMDTFGDD